MVRVIVQYRHGSIKLLREHHAREPVGKCKRRERPLEGRGALDGLREAVGPSYDEGEVRPAVTPALDTVRELRRREQSAALVQRYPEAPGRDGREYALLLGFEQATDWAAGAAAFRLDFGELEARIARHAPRVLVEP